MADLNPDTIDAGEANDLEININMNLPVGQENAAVAEVEMNETIDFHLPEVRLGPPEQAPNNAANDAQNNQAPNVNNPANQFGTVRDRLFHAMLVRVALKYSSKVNLTCRRMIEAGFLFMGLILLCSLCFVHLKFTRSHTTCLDDLPTESFKEGVIRVEVVRNLHVLEEYEDYIKWYVSEKSTKTCNFNMKDVFLYGVQALPLELRSKKVGGDFAKSSKKGERSEESGWLMATLKATMGASEQINRLDGMEEDLNFGMEDDEEEVREIQEEDEEADERSGFEDPYEAEANLAWENNFGMKYKDNKNFRFLYQIEYAQLYGVLRLPTSYREKYGIPMVWKRIDARDKCFGDTLTKLMMRWFVGYEDAIISSLRAKAANISANSETNNMGYLHDLQTHEHYHFVANMLGRSSYLTAAFLMLIFTFAISMLLRFSHHQIFIFIIDLLHMFELQQPLQFPVAPIFTVILALVGMEAIMSEVFNDTSTAFYVILIVWVADQYDAICCHSAVSKKYWLRFFFTYQFFFYSYQYRFGGQYGNLALLTSAVFIIHSMIYFFHHYEMPLILYQDRVQQVLTDLHANQNGMGTVEVQTITVAMNRNARHSGSSSVAPATPTASEDGGEQGGGQAEPIVQVREPLSPSSVFDARGPSFVPEEEAPTSSSEVLNSPPEEPEPTMAEEIVAHQIVNDAMNQLFNNPMDERKMSLPTPQYRLSAIRAHDVYEPAEDTFLLIDAIEKDIKEIRSRDPKIVLEIGCGSGVVSTFVNQALGGNVTSLATDLNPHALDITLETAKLNDIKIDVVRTDLEAGLENLQGKVDLLLFNPPYVPTEEEPKSNIELTYAGGKTGRSTLDRLLPRIPDLLSPTGVFYLVALHANDIPSLLKYSDRLKASISMERRCGIEHLYILKFLKI